MTPLETNRRMLTLLSVHLADETTSIWKKLAYAMIAFSVLTLHVCSIVSSAVHFGRFVSTDMGSALFGMLQIVGCVNMAYMLTIAILLRHRITAIFESLSIIYKTHAEEESMRFLAAANSQCEWLWKFFFIFVMCGAALNTMMLVFVSTLFCWFSNESTVNTECLSHPFQYTLPWNQQTLLGYFGEICFDILSGEAFLTCGSFILFFISLCLHHRAFYYVIQHLVSEFGQNNEKQSDRETLRKVIQFHISVKNLFIESSNAFSYFILVQLICTVLTLACGIFQIDLLIQNIGFAILFVVMLVSINILNLFLYCFFGKKATDSYRDMAICLYEANWQNLPLRLQTFFVIMIGNAQRPMYYHGFGVAILDLETFTKFLRLVYTCYMIFKTITPD